MIDIKQPPPTELAGVVWRLGHCKNEKNTYPPKYTGGRTSTLNNILFETGKDWLLPASYAEVMNRVATFMKANPTLRVEILGHTDAQESPALNKNLSADNLSRFFPGPFAFVRRIETVSALLG